MDSIAEILKIILPAGIVFLTTFYTVRHFLEKETKERMIETKKYEKHITTPLRLQAYERLLLYLERADMDKLMTRTIRQGMSARRFHDEMSRILHTELEHNITQQLYVSDDAWKAVETAKDEIIKIIGLAFTKAGAEASAIDLSKEIYSVISKLPGSPSEIATEKIKREARQLF